MSARFIGWSLAALLLAAALGSIAVALLIWNSSLSLDQRLVAEGDTFTAGAFTLAVLGSIVALLAYRLALQRPRLSVVVRADEIPLGGTDELPVIEVLLAPPDETGERRIVRWIAGLSRTTGFPLQISVANASDYSARNVAVRVDFKGVRRVPHVAGWAVAAYHPVIRSEIISLQWEAGADYAIHGRWARELPPLELSSALLEAPGEDCRMTVDVVAEGFRKAWAFPIKWQSLADDLRERAGGAISGWTGYPSSGVPQLRIYAIPVSRHGLPLVTEPVIGYSYRWFWFNDVEPGEYHIVAYRKGYKVAGAYTRGAKANDSTATADHTLVAVVVKRGEVTDGVRITDWYASDSFPPEPDRALNR